MSRSVCTNRSFIVLMSFEKKPMAFRPFLVRKSAVRATALSTSNVQRRRGFLRHHSIRMPECHVADVGTRSTNSAGIRAARRRPRVDHPAASGWRSARRWAGHDRLSTGAAARICAGAWERPPTPRRRPFESEGRITLPYLRAGEPVVAGFSSGTHVVALRSYLKPLALLRASLVEFMTKYHLLLFLFVTWT